MRFLFRFILVSSFSIPLVANIYAADAKLDVGAVEKGRQLAQSTAKGNCLACHQIPNDAKMVTSATIGPPLVAIKERYVKREVLKNQIWDATKNNPDTVMPPFGKHKILTDAEIELIIDYLYSL